MSKQAIDENEVSLKAVTMMLNNEWEAVDQMLISLKYFFRFFFFNFKF